MAQLKNIGANERRLCSPDHSLFGCEFRLWQKNYLALRSIKDAVLATGYTIPERYRDGGNG